MKFKNFSFDYAYSNYGDLGLSNRFEFGFRFGVIRPTLSPEERDILRRAKRAYAQERYGEATLLFSSLVDLEPNYHPAKRYMLGSMKMYDIQDHAQNSAGRRYNLSVNRPFAAPKDDSEMGELMQLLSLDETSKTAAVSSRGLSAETSTLAPVITDTTVDPATPLRLRSEKGGKP